MVSNDFKIWYSIAIRLSHFLASVKVLAFLLSSVIASTLELIPSICPEISLIKIIWLSIQIQLKNIFKLLRFLLKYFGNE
jgi:hypothetical protein